MKSNLLANLVYFLHLSIIIFVFLGNLILTVKYLPYLALLIIIIFLDWNDFDGMCILTKLEHYFRTDQWISQPATEEGGPEFFRPLIIKITGIDISRKAASRLNNFLFMIILLITLLRIKFQNLSILRR
jgi:hypothetical protein